MKKILVALFTVFAFNFSLRADIIFPDGHTPAEDRGPIEPFVLKKLSRGLANTALAAFEVPKSVYDTGYQEGIFGIQQFSLGLPRGFHKMFLRFGTGLNDLATVAEPSRPLWHVEPEYLGLRDIIPGFNSQFDGWGDNWETTDTPAFHMDTFDSPSWRQ